MYFFYENPIVGKKSNELNYNVKHHILDHVHGEHDHNLDHNHAVKFDVK